MNNPTNIEEINPQDIKVDKKVLKKGLNPKIWDQGGVLKPEVRTGLLKIAKEFYGDLKIDAKPKDILFLGSMANYNWNKNSDLDLHLMFDFSEINENEKLLEEYFLSKKALWALKHNITIHGFPVEVYVQNINETNKSIGVYSLQKNMWVKKPHKENVQIDVDLIQSKAADLINQIDSLDNIKDQTKKYELADKIKDKIKRFRQSGLDTDGEFSTENLAFKTLRNNGYLEKLADLKIQSIDNMLTIAEDDKVTDHTNVNLTLGIEEGLDISKEHIELIKKFINFTWNKLKMENPVKVYLHQGRDKYIATTASYINGEDENHIRVGGRALVDICRSIGHELTHNRQREIGIIQVGVPVTNIGGKIEDMANSIAGILIKDFTHNYGYDGLYDF